MNRRRAISASVLCLVASLGLIACGSDPAASPKSSATVATVATADDALLQSAVDRLVDGEGGDQLDRACVEEKFSALSDEALQLVNEAAPDSTDPRLGPISLQLLDCLDLGAGGTSVAADPPGAAPASVAVDPCALLSPTQLEPIFAGLDPGSYSSISSNLGEGTTCEWSNPNDGKTVSLSIYPDADLVAWTAAATNGDGVSDGEPIKGVGDSAFINRGDLTFAHGTILVMLHCFPSFDITPETLAATARVVDAQL